MNEKQFKMEVMAKTFAKILVFEQWVKEFFYLHSKLSTDSDRHYLQLFIIRLHDILVVGVPFAKEASSSLGGRGASAKADWYQRFADAFSDLRASLSESEWMYLDYRRNCACHMFQEKFEIIQDSFVIKTNRNGVLLTEINAEISGLFKKYGMDQGVEDYLVHKLSPGIDAAYASLKP